MPGNPQCNNISIILICANLHFIRREFFTDKLDEVINKIVAYYVDRDEENTHDFYLDRYTEFLSDVMFNVPAVDGILGRRDKGWNLYAYSFNHYNEAIWSEDIPKRMRGSTHINEYPYMFDMFPFGQYEIDEKEQIVADVIQQSFINFVKTGVPLNQHAVWQNIGTSTAPRHLAISPIPHMEDGFFNESTTLWHQIREYGFDLITQYPTREVSRIHSNEL
ncbi:COesterase domain-containing protein [Trichostrongylus colubriformis]|uniref:COesterase domain-containing protein n=1 Tax=Trichostrongylus colubriformis TaxID=6319 RepID=A0AAN8G5N3_TRICO